ncbi:MAG: integrase core domain-containing protein [Leptospiraceae bacterium]|nr:integrase core domain-containing protein [Leptospiraceae bacterium]
MNPAVDFLRHFRGASTPESLRILLRAERVLLIALILFLLAQLRFLMRRKKQVRLKTGERLTLATLVRLFPGLRSFIVIVKPDTLTRILKDHGRSIWGLKIIWGKIKARVNRFLNRKTPPGRPLSYREIIGTIGHMLTVNGWGIRRITMELNMLGVKISKATVGRYIKRFFPDYWPFNRRKKRLAWRTMLLITAQGVCSMDFFVTLTSFGRSIYNFFIIRHSDRAVIHTGATYFPSSLWVKNQLKDCFIDIADCPTKIIFDNDHCFKCHVNDFFESMPDIKPVRTSYRSPWQNGVAERWVKSARTDLFDLVPVESDVQAAALLKLYAKYFNFWRCHETLGGSSPFGRPVFEKLSEDARIVPVPLFGGLFHTYRWQSTA